MHLADEGGLPSEDSAELPALSEKGSAVIRHTILDSSSPMYLRILESPYSHLRISPKKAGSLALYQRF